MFKQITRMILCTFSVIAVLLVMISGVAHASDTKVGMPRALVNTYWVTQEPRNSSTAWNYYHGTKDTFSLFNHDGKKIGANHIVYMKFHTGYILVGDYETNIRKNVWWFVRPNKANLQIHVGYDIVTKGHTPKGLPKDYVNSIAKKISKDRFLQDYK
ncbi:hypothetical protein [Lentilactobacillus kefiri]|uniref:Uncharacterized protein n=1 Tax=Lentilactobacillus kefiri TaxID=33962 RepID=A0A511DWQ8_LENKE|nr:hypothetical protein [Lentilactobacillus kefiri]MCJ2162660.1 hypothetical protein [Lentilactobacillus kefiri]MCP9370004.1 hypothetical protein [Lentilactobacillus kefiri]MDH5109344.1 hypothetical protein [Lentilactobacillus kefiri]PAK58631.1 hypothetical protein B9K02_10435 [Lentilactobacillus kefiri]PAK81173.1 hypothetical protein B8W85_10415 [Lentilactobacillus kefiri]